MHAEPNRAIANRAGATHGARSGAESTTPCSVGCRNLRQLRWPGAQPERPPAVDVENSLQHNDYTRAHSKPCWRLPIPSDIAGGAAHTQSPESRPRSDRARKNCCHREPGLGAPAPPHRQIARSPRDQRDQAGCCDANPTDRRNRARLPPGAENYQTPRNTRGCSQARHGAATT